MRLGAAEPVSGLFCKRERGTDFGEDPADGVEVDGFRFQQLFDDLSVLIGIAHVMLLFARHGGGPLVSIASLAGIVRATRISFHAGERGPDGSEKMGGRKWCNSLSFGRR
jgi:hypothetical protein